MEIESTYLTELPWKGSDSTCIVLGAICADTLIRTEMDFRPTVSRTVASDLVSPYPLMRGACETRTPMFHCKWKVLANYTTRPDISSRDRKTRTFTHKASGFESDSATDYDISLYEWGKRDSNSHVRYFILIVVKWTSMFKTDAATDYAIPPYLVGLVGFEPTTSCL